MVSAMCLEASFSAPNPLGLGYAIFAFLRRKYLTFMPRLSVLPTSSDVGHCKDTTHVSHKDEPGHTEKW